ncbi:MAG: hypothetical protein ACRD1C_11090 [Terriglobales bacterium]
MLLTETELRSTLEPLLDQLLAERLRLFQLQFEARMQSLIDAALAPQSASELQAGLRRLQTAATLGECFEAIYELSAALVGPQRALFVVWQEQKALWKSTGEPSRLSSGCRAEIKVRGRAVGELVWPGAPLPAAMAERLEVLLRLAGLVLLERALPAVGPTAAGPTAVAQPPRQESNALSWLAHAGETRAQRFASLLIEDLRLFLTRERAQEFAAGARAGDWRQQFAPELERCRGAYRDRYGETETFEEAVSRLVELPV